MIREGIAERDQPPDPSALPEIISKSDFQRSSLSYRHPVSLILGHLTAGTTPEGIIGEFPDLTKEQIAACLDDARALSGQGPKARDP